MTRRTDADIARIAIGCLDLTELSTGCDDADVQRLCARARTPHGDVAAVCVHPPFAALAREMLGASRIRVAAVANFPAGGERAEAAVADIEAAEAADEIDVVMPYRAFAEGRADVASAVLRAARSAAGGRTLKVILETGMLRETGIIRRAADMAIDEGADFIKTSTGKVEVNATPDAMSAMLMAALSARRVVGVKPSGGVRTVEDARTYIELAEAAMGLGWVDPAVFRIGASGVLTALIGAIDGVKPRASAAAY